MEVSISFRLLKKGRVVGQTDNPLIRHTAQSTILQKSNHPNNPTTLILKEKNENTGHNAQEIQLGESQDENT